MVLARGRVLALQREKRPSGGASSWALLFTGTEGSKSSKSSIYIVIIIYMNWFRIDPGLIPDWDRIGSGLIPLGSDP